MPVVKTKTIPDRVYLSASFIEGAAILSVEILGAKILSPFFGNSLIVWTSVIGITIAFLALGYFAGGFLSARQNFQKLLSYVLSLAGILILLIPICAPHIFSWVAEKSLYNASILAACLLLGPSMFVLGSTSPIIIQALTKGVASPGKKAGLVYAFSTLGGMCFIFLFGFWLIPILGMTKLLAGISVLVFLIALRVFRGKVHIAVTFIYVIFLLNLLKQKENNFSSGTSIRYMTEGLMGQLMVMDKVYPGNPSQFRHLMINGIPETIITNDQEAISGWAYTHKTGILASLKKDNHNALLFGFGGGVMATEFSKLKMKTDVVEIDERLLKVAKKYFYFNDSSITYTVDDARHFMRTSKKQYDFIVFDVFNGEVTPSYLFTVEGTNELKKLLKKNGILTIQFNEMLDANEKSAYQSICNTLLSQGFKVYYNFTSSDITSILITASMENIDFSLLDKKNVNACCASLAWTEDFIKNPMIQIEKQFPNGMILTDDQPLLDLLNAKTLKYWRQWAITNYSQPALKENKKIFK